MSEKSLVEKAKEVIADAASMAQDAIKKTGDAAAKADKAGDAAAKACEETKGAAAAATDSASKRS